MQVSDSSEQEWVDPNERRNEKENQVWDKGKKSLILDGLTSVRYGSYTNESEAHEKAKIVIGGNKTTVNSFSIKCYSLSEFSQSSVL